MEDDKRHPVKAVILTVLSLIIFVALVWIGVSMITSNIPEIENIFQNTGMYAVLIGIPLAITIGITNYFSKGDKKRLVFGLISTALLVIYFVFILRSLNLGFEGDEFTYAITLPGIIILTAIACMIRGVLYGVEYYLYQKETVEKNEERSPQYY